MKRIGLRGGLVELGRGKVLCECEILNGVIFKVIFLSKVNLFLGLVKWDRTDKIINIKGNYVEMASIITDIVQNVGKVDNK